LKTPISGGITPDKLLDAKKKKKNETNARQVIEDSIHHNLEQLTNFCGITKKKRLT